VGLFSDIKWVPLPSAVRLCVLSATTRFTLRSWRDSSDKRARRPSRDLINVARGQLTKTWSQFSESWCCAEGPPHGLRSRVGTNHRMLSTYLNTTTRHGLDIEQVAEPEPLPEWVRTASGEDPRANLLASPLPEGRSRSRPQAFTFPLTFCALGSLLHHTRPTDSFSTWREADSC
jgi:hypothetical protein